MEAIYIHFNVHRMLNSVLLQALQWTESKYWFQESLLKQSSMP